MPPRIIALYLPQFHAIPENDKWYGEGFTEWTNVRNAKKLYKGHYQPIEPHEDLGYYNLENTDVLKKQTEIAKKYGVEAFCFYHYWFGNGKRLLEKPLKNVIADKTIQFPICLAWANHSWEKKLWDPNQKNELILKQEYPGETDIKNHFYALLDVFKDSRYLKVDGKLFFLIYDPFGHPSIANFIDIWRKLAKKENLDDFYFVGTDFDLRSRDKILNMGFDAIYNENTLNIHHHLKLFQKISLLIKRKFLKKPSVFKYSDAIKHMVSNDSYNLEIIPSVAPNWDHSPRSSNNAMILKDSDPKLFEWVLSKAAKLVIEKPKDHQIIIIKSWNEWGEGNYLEPDKKFGYSYLNAISNVMKSFSGSDNL